MVTTMVQNNKKVQKKQTGKCRHGIEVIGLGLTIDDLTEKHKKIIAQADLLVGGRRHLQFFEQMERESFLETAPPCTQRSQHVEDASKTAPVSRETLTITRDIQGLINIIKSRMIESKIVVLASGDPLFNGIGSTLIKALGKEHVTVHPNISSVAAAFAAIKEPWHDAVLLSLHGKDVENLGKILADSDKIAILTDHKRTPAWLARFMVRENILHHGMYVLENLGAANEQILFFEDMDLSAKTIFSSPNIVILKRLRSIEKQNSAKDLKNQSTDSHLGAMGGIATSPPSGKRPDTSIPSKKGPDTSIPSGKMSDHGKGSHGKSPQIFPGMPEELFFHEKGLITKAEVRAVVLSKLKLISDHHIFWDLGAGSGSISIEASKFLPNGTLFAVEKNNSRILDIQRNIKKFAVPNMTVVQGELPCGMDSLPHPHRIFIGGGGRNIADIINSAGQRLIPGGIMVVNTVLLQSMDMALQTMKNMKFKTDLVQIQVSVSREMPFGERLEALNPVWIISGQKRE